MSNFAETMVACGFDEELRALFEGLCLADDAMRSIPAVAENRKEQLQAFRRLAGQAFDALIDADESLVKKDVNWNRVGRARR